MRRFLMTAVTIGTAMGAAYAQGPTSNYFLTAGDDGNGWIAQGTNATSFGLQNNEFAVAVNSTVRTLANGNTPSSTVLGSEYTLGGVFTGTTYAYPANASFYDGTTDGTFNYSVDYSSGDVYRMNSDWSNPTVLFNVGGDGYLGITYDASNASLWVSNFNGFDVRQYTLGGSLLSTFNLPFTASSSLALDPADGTLWMGSQGTQGTFYQYSQAGVQLSTVTYNDLVSQNTLGGEFAVTAASAPEPGSLALLGLVVPVVGLVRRRKA